MLGRFNVSVGEDSDGFYIHHEYSNDGHYCKAEDAIKAVTYAAAYAQILALQTTAKSLMVREEYYAAKIVLEIGDKLLHDYKIQSGT